MTDHTIVCKPTRDTFMRFAIVLAAFFGFGMYFFYDGSVGYRKANEAFFTYQAFAQLGKDVTESSAAEWAATRASSPLLKAQQDESGLYIEQNEQRFPLPDNCEPATICPPEAADFAALSKGWNECWLAYSARMHYPEKPGEHGHDTAAIREQWYAGSVCMLISAIIIWLMLRTSRRVMSLQGDTVTAAGTSFSIADITLLDLRQWGKGFKGIAYATVQGKRIRMDGMTYGGFSPDAGEPAEQFMQALLSRYQGKILEYEKPDKKVG
ncbi:MAG: hypothetical protein IKK45_02560 [Akkermansia sp.]|nr:hypothetical protein [Akkermansia sp.]